MNYSLDRIISDSIEVNIDESLILEWVAKNYDPDEVFSYMQLSAWAEDSGYTLDKS